LTRQPLKDSIAQINMGMINSRKIIKEEREEGELSLEEKGQIRLLDIFPNARTEIMQVLLHNGYIKNPNDVIIGADNISRWSNFEFFLNV
jgi:hypothetical protein